MTDTLSLVNFYIDPLTPKCLIGVHARCSAQAPLLSLLANSKSKSANTTPTTLYKSLSSPPATGCISATTEDRLGLGGREGRRTSGGMSASNLGSPVHPGLSPGSVPHSGMFSCENNHNYITIISIGYVFM